MGWIIAAVIAAVLASIPLGVGIQYDSDGLVVRVFTWLFHFTIIPLPPKKEKKNKKTKQSPVSNTEKLQPITPAADAKKTAKSRKASTPHKTPKPEKKKKGGSLLDFIPLVRLGLRFLNDFRKKLRVNKLELALILAADDPCDLAVNYGRAWAAIGNLLPVLERVLVIQKRDIEVECDFTAQETLVRAHFDISITLGRVLSMGVYYGFGALIEYLKLRKKRKGGAAV